MRLIKKQFIHLYISSLFIETKLLRFTGLLANSCLSLYERKQDEKLYYDGCFHGGCFLLYKWSGTGLN